MAIMAVGVHLVSMQMQVEDGMTPRRSLEGGSAAPSGVEHGRQADFVFGPATLRASHLVGVLLLVLVRPQPGGELHGAQGVGHAQLFQQPRDAAAAGRDGVVQHDVGRHDGGGRGYPAASSSGSDPHIKGRLAGERQHCRRVMVVLLSMTQRSPCMLPMHGAARSQSFLKHHPAKGSAARSPWRQRLLNDKANGAPATRAAREMTSVMVATM